MFFHQGAPALGEAALRTERDLQALRTAAAAHLSPAGQLQVATALAVLAELETQLEALRHQLVDAARHLAGAKVLAERLYGVGPATALALTASRAPAAPLRGRSAPPDPAARSQEPAAIRAREHSEVRPQTVNGPSRNHLRSRSDAGKRTARPP